MEVTVRNSDIANFGSRVERKTNLTEHVNRRGPRSFEKSTEAKILSHIKEFTRIQKGDPKMNHRTRDTASGISSNRSNFAKEEMRVKVPNVPPNIAPPETAFVLEAISVPQMTISQLIISHPPTNQPKQKMTLSTSAPMETLHQVRPRTTRRAKKFQNILDSKTLIHPVNQQSNVLLIQHSPAENVGLVMSNRYNLLWNKPILIQQPKQNQSLHRSLRQP